MDVTESAQSNVDPNAVVEVWLCTFDPLDPGGGVGGLDWFYKQADAERRYEELVAENKDEPHGWRVRMWNAFPIKAWTRDEITDYLDTEFIGNDPEGAPMRDTHGT